jgi:hypothetical protein
MMAKRKPRRRAMRTHAEILRRAQLIEDQGDKQAADLIRKLAKDRFRAVMTYKQDRDFSRILTDEEIFALPPPKPFPWLKD